MFYYRNCTLYGVLRTEYSLQSSEVSVKGTGPSRPLLHQTVAHVGSSTFGANLVLIRPYHILRTNLCIYGYQRCQAKLQNANDWALVDWPCHSNCHTLSLTLLELETAGRPTPSGKICNSYWVIGFLCTSVWIDQLTF